MKSVQRSGSTKGPVQEHAVGRCVDQEDKSGVVNQHPGIIGTHQAATMLLEMSAKAVEEHCRNVKGMSNKNPLAIKG
jgi:hypothetical protein